jgi:uncharacterized protein (DUF2147 family)
MIRLPRLFAACALLLAATDLAAAAEQFRSPKGKWEIETRDSRYEVTMCGPDKTQICGTLYWLARGAKTEENLAMLNTMIIDHAPMIGPNQWRGTLKIGGMTATGTITQLGDNLIELEGCALMVICRTYEMHRRPPRPRR